MWDPKNKGILMRRFTVLIVLLACGCDRAAPAPAPPAVKAGPLPGILVLRPGPLPPELTKDAAYRPGLPSLGLQVEYPGPKLGLRVEVQGFEKGVSRASSKDHRLISLPLIADLGFGFGEGKNSEGTLQPAVIQSFGVSSADGHSRTRTGGSGTMAIAPIGERRCQTWEPKWPLEIADGQEEIVWAVFVAEPEGDRKDVPILERVKQAEAAWIFKAASSEKPKQ